MNEHHAERLDVLSIYWHFVDAVWVVVFTVVYVIGTMKDGDHRKGGHGA